MTENTNNIHDQVLWNKIYFLTFQSAATSYRNILYHTSFLIKD